VVVVLVVVVLVRAPLEAERIQNSTSSAWNILDRNKHVVVSVITRDGYPG
jgi:hypothetical protein